MGHICVDPPNTNNIWVEFGLVNVDTFIIRVGFGLPNVDTIRTLTRHEHDPLTRIATPKSITYFSQTLKRRFLHDFNLENFGYQTSSNSSSILLAKW